LWEEDTYDLFVYGQNLTSPLVPDELATLSKKIAPGTTYTFVLLEDAGSVVIDTLEAPTVLGSAADAQINALHAVEGLAPVDLYLIPTGTDFLGTTPWGTLSFRGQLAPRNIAAGEYELVVTPAGDQSTVLMHTSLFTLAAASDTTLVLAGETGEGLVPFSVIFEQAGNALTVVDRDAPSAVRAINAATDKGARDVAFNSAFSPPLFPSVPFATATGYAPIAASGDVVVNVTPPGNPGVLELDQHVATIAGQSHTLLFAGDAGALTFTFDTDLRRRIVNQAQLTIYDNAPQFAALFVILLPAGSAIDPGTAGASLTLIPGSSNVAALPPDGYDVYLRDATTIDSTLIVAGPIPITVAGSGIYSLLVTNGADTTKADVAQFDDFLP
jgi:hypothetical protein